MNNNKQPTKGYKVRKLAIVIGILSVLATGAQAGGYVCKPNVYGGTTCVYDHYAWELIIKYENAPEKGAFFLNKTNLQTLLNNEERI